MITGVTYADDLMSISKEKCISSMHKNDIEAVYEYERSNLSQEFINNNIDVFSQSRGGGYWLWKPWAVNRAIQHCHDGDILIYSDAGVEFVNGVHHIIDRMDEDIFFFTNGFPHVEWCKEDVIDGINKVERYSTQCGVVLGSDYFSHKQVQASVIFFKVNETTRNFVKEWLLWCQMPGFIDDSPSKLPNYPTFAEHRHDQAILTCLQIKYGYKLHWWPTQYSEHIRVSGDTYPVMFNHHRKRNEEW